MRKIFICYRRVDAEYAAGALGRELREVFGDGQVFRDKEDFGVGKSWRAQALHEIDRDAVLVLLIGRSWSNASAPRRLEDSDDPVRTELLDARQDGAAIIPILLEDVDMPTPAELPPALHWLCDLTARHLRDADWRYDLDKIFASIEGLGFERLQGRAQPGAAFAKNGSAPWSAKLVAAAVVFVLCVFGMLGSDGDKEAYLGLAILGCVATVLSVFAYRDAKRGLVRSRRGALALSVLSGVLSVGGFLFSAGSEEAPSDAAKASASAEPSAVVVRALALQAAPQGVEMRFPGTWHEVDGDGVLHLAERNDSIWLLDGDKVIAEGKLQGKTVQLTATEGAEPGTRLRLTLDNDGSLQGQFEGDGPARSMRYRRE